MTTTNADFRQAQLDQYRKATSFCKTDKHIWVWARDTTDIDEPDASEFCCCGKCRWSDRYLILKEINGIDTDSTAQ